MNKARRRNAPMPPLVIQEDAAEIELQPTSQSWLVTIHWPHRTRKSRLNFETEQAAREWIETASSKWVAEHSLNRPLKHLR